MLKCLRVNQPPSSTIHTQSAITRSKIAIEILEQGVIYVQSSSVFIFNFEHTLFSSVSIVNFE